jgi:undecaprenyl diphosphate synthase
MAIDTRINQSKLPKHVAVIMDGNGRWAKQRGKLRTFGHGKGVKAVRETVETAAEMGIEYLTLYAFSTENWNRPKFEVNALMTLLVKTINKETKTLTENNIRLNAIGDLQSLPSSCLKELNEAIEKTKSNTRMTLTLALSYSSKWEMTEAIKAIAKNVKSGKLDMLKLSMNQPLMSIFARLEFLTLNYLLEQVENIASPTFCCGKLPMQNCILQTNYGPILKKAILKRQ